jgi:transposase
MAFRELHMVEVKECLRLWAQGKGYRTIAKQTGLARNTVKRHVAAAVAAGLERGDVEMALDDTLLATVVDQLQPGGSTQVGALRALCRENKTDIEKWAKTCDAPKIQRLLWRKKGVRVPLRTLQRFVKEDLSKGSTGTVRIDDPKPGVLEFDFLEFGWFDCSESGKRRKMYAALMTASVSRHQLLWPCLSLDRAAVIEALEQAWSFFGGVFPVLLPDNLSPVVDKADGVNPKLNAWFVEYAQARGFEIDTARVRKPKDKARVERQVRYARRDFFGGESFTDVAQTQKSAVHWSMETAGMRVHGTTRRQPRLHFEEVEKAVLLAPPSEPYDTPKWVDLKVGRDHAVVVEKALYSVPHTLGECRLRVRIDRSLVKFYLGRRLVKVHPRQPAGATRLDAADAPPGLAPLVKRDASSLCELAGRHGAAAEAYARRLADGPLPWSRIRHVYRLVGLINTYGGSAVNEACSRALELEVIDVMRIQRMLENGLSSRRNPKPRPRKKPQGEVLTFARATTEFALPEGDHAST